MRKRIIFGLLFVIVMGTIFYFSFNQRPVQRRQKTPEKLYLGHVDSEIASGLIQTQTRIVSDDVYQDITPPEVWSRMGLQLFRTTDQSRIQTYVIKTGRVTQISGAGWSGTGLQQFCVSDLNNDGEPELIYTYEWGGSGIPGFMLLNMYPFIDKGDLFPSALGADSFETITLKKIDDQTIIMEQTRTNKKNLYGKLILKQVEGIDTLDADFSRQKQYKELWEQASFNKIYDTQGKLCGKK